MKEYEKILQEYESLIGKNDKASAKRRKQIVDWLAASDGDEVKGAAYAMLISHHRDIDTYNAICKDMGDKLEDVVDTKIKRQLRDIMDAVSWREIANIYFHKHSSWLYHKFNGIDGTGGFNAEETEQLRGALVGLSDRIRRAAENI